MAKSEKLKKLDVDATKGISGGAVFSALDKSVNGKVYFVSSDSDGGVEKFVNLESAQKYAKFRGLSDEEFYFKEDIDSARNAAKFFNKI